MDHHPDDPISLGGQTFDAIKREDDAAADLAREIDKLLKNYPHNVTCASAIDALAWCIGDMILEDAPYDSTGCTTLGGKRLVRYARHITRRRIDEAVKLASSSRIRRSCR